MRATLGAVLGLAVALLAGAAAAAPGADDPALRKELQAVLDERAAALQKRDVAAYVKCWTADFRLLQVDGTAMDRRAAEAAVRGSLAKLATVKNVSATIEHLARRGNTVVVLVRHGISGYPPDGDGRSARLVWAAGTAEQTWARTPGGWVLRQVKQRTNKSTM